MDKRVRVEEIALSIFKVFRRKAFDAMGGYDDAQNVSKSSGKNMKKAGYLPVITTAESNIVAQHFREKNKGYPEGFTDFHTYDPRR